MDLSRATLRHVRLNDAHLRDVDLTGADLRAAYLAFVVSPVGPGGPEPSMTFTVAECLSVVLNEEWENRLYAERDLTTLAAPT